MMELFEKGGFMMYPILLCSVIALAVIIERFYVVFWKTPRPNQAKIDEVFRLSEAGDITEAIKIIASSPSGLAATRESKPTTLKL